MSAEAKITLRDAAGRMVEIHAVGHQNEHASSLIAHVSEAAKKQAELIGLLPPVPGTQPCRQP